MQRLLREHYMHNITRVDAFNHRQATVARVERDIRQIESACRHLHTHTLVSDAPSLVHKVGVVGDEYTSGSKAIARAATARHKQHMCTLLDAPYKRWLRKDNVDELLTGFTDTQLEVHTLEQKLDEL
jgi:hypothetical protein